MGIYDYIGLKEKDIVSIVGAGGKTSFMFRLAKEMKEDSKVLVTTTTKIYVPPKEDYDFICTDEKMFLEYAKINKNGIYTYGMGINAENKLIGLDENVLDQLVPNFDYILMEADGSKKKKIKGWNLSEPIVYKKSTKTIGILDIQALGMTICEENVHRSEIFCQIADAREGQTIGLKHLVNIITNPKGLFKNAAGERILFINKVECPHDLKVAKELFKRINEKSSNEVDKILAGSIKNDHYFYVEE